MVVYDDYGIEWALVALVVFPVTIVVAPILAVMNDPENGFPLFVTAVLIVWTLYAFFKRDRKKAVGDADAGFNNRFTVQKNKHLCTIFQCSWKFKELNFVACFPISRKRLNCCRN